MSIACPGREGYRLQWKNVAVLTSRARHAQEGSISVTSWVMAPVYLCSSTQSSISIPQPSLPPEYESWWGQLCGLHTGERTTALSFHSAGLHATAGGLLRATALYVLPDTTE